MFMKKFIAMIMMVLFMSTSLTGCGTLFSKEGLEYATNVIDLKAESTLIKKQYERIYNIIIERQDSFSEEEIAQLNDIHFAFSETAIRVGEMMDDPINVVTPDELRSMYELAYIGYTNARDIVSVHKEEFTAYQWSQMIQFDAKAREYDVQVRKVLDNPDTADINMTLGVMITLGGAAYKYLLPVLVSLI